MKSFICISGLDGAGKTTQYKLLHEYLLPMKPLQNIFEEDTSKDVNRALINFVKKTNLVLNDNQMHVIKSAYHMYFDIKQLTQENKYNDKVVILDRYVETIYAHAQFYGLAPGVIADIFEDIYIKPDYYFFLDIDPNVCYERILRRHKVLEPHENLESLIQLYGFYRNIVINLGIEFIDANKSPSELHQYIISKIKIS